VDCEAFYELNYGTEHGIILEKSAISDNQNSNNECDSNEEDTGGFCTSILQCCFVE
jgi:hypothetical protein